MRELPWVVQLGGTPVISGLPGRGRPKRYGCVQDRSIYFVGLGGVPGWTWQNGRFVVPLLRSKGVDGLKRNWYSGEVVEGVPLTSGGELWVRTVWWRIGQVGCGFGCGAPGA